MTPAARYAAAIEVLDHIQDGVAAEKALTAWARSNRFAGSKDRTAVRDHVFVVLRCKRSCAAFGGGDDGRRLILGLLRQDGISENDVFHGEGYAPKKLTAAEVAGGHPPATDAERLDIPDWMWPLWCAALGDGAKAAAESQRERARLCLRVNMAKTTPESAIDCLLSDDIAAERHPNVPTALIVTSNPRRVAQSKAYLEGLVEVQDASSQAAVLEWPLQEGQRVLDYCAGGGGKSLAIAAETRSTVTAHDIAPDRMKDIPVRAKRAGAQIVCSTATELPKDVPFDVVLCDAPCSGSGTWRRNPDAKWRLTQDDLKAYQATQRSVLKDAVQYVHPDGTLIYATCSVFQDENDETIESFLEVHPEFRVVNEKLMYPSAETDGFYFCVLQRN